MVTLEPWNGVDSQISGAPWTVQRISGALSSMKLPMSKSELIQKTEEDTGHVPLWVVYTYAHVHTHICFPAHALFTQEERHCKMESENPQMCCPVVVVQRERGLWHEPAERGSVYHLGDSI